MQIGMVETHIHVGRLQSVRSMQRTGSINLNKKQDRRYQQAARETESQGGSFSQLLFLAMHFHVFILKSTIEYTINMGMVHIFSLTVR